MRSFVLGDPAGPPIIGWDVGGVNLKAARLAGGTVSVVIEPFELQRAPDQLSTALASLARRLQAGPVDLAAAVPGEAPDAILVDGCALTGDVHLWLGNLLPEDYTVNPPDGRLASHRPAGPRGGTSRPHRGGGRSAPAGDPDSAGGSGRRRRIAVVKLGGGLLPLPGALERAARAIAAGAARHPLVVVPGGGSFADAVRRFDQEHGLSAEAAHWMAILAQDQYAHVLAERVPGAVLVCDPQTIAAAHAAGRIPVLAPSRWMLAADVLPHQWDATSDTVAAFVAGAVDADLLVLVKPVSGGAADLTDACFSATLPAGLAVVVLGAGEVDRLAEVLDAGVG